MAIAEKLQEIEKLKEEVENIRKVAEDNLTSGNDIKLRRLKNICLKLQADNKKVKEEHEKEKCNIYIIKNKMKWEDSLKTTIYENEQLQVKDETFLKEFHASTNVAIDGKVPEKSDQSSKNQQQQQQPSHEEQQMIYVCHQYDFQSKRENIVLEYIKVLPFEYWLQICACKEILKDILIEPAGGPLHFKKKIP